MLMVGSPLNPSQRSSLQKERRREGEKAHKLAAIKEMEPLDDGGMEV